MRRERRLLVVALVLALAPGCGLLRVDVPEDGVTVKPLTADLAFGAATLAEAVATAPIVAGTGVDVALGLLDDFGDFASGASPTLLRPISVGVICPEAAPNAFPAEEATQTVRNGPPKAGSYRWKQSGTLEIPGLLPKTSLAGLTSRSVRNVVTAAAATTFDYVIPGGLTGTETQSLEVRADGVYLTRLRFELGQQSLDFEPFPLPLKLFSLPVSTGEAVSATGVDPVDRLSFTLTGRMGTRERIDACGTVIDAWKFSGSRVVQPLLPNDTRGVRSTTYEFLFAPQLGGMFVGERAVTTGSIGPFVYQTDVTATIGEISPGRPE